MNSNELFNVFHSRLYMRAHYHLFAHKSHKQYGEAVVKFLPVTVMPHWRVTILAATATQDLCTQLV